MAEAKISLSIDGVQTVNSGLKQVGDRMGDVTARVNDQTAAINSLNDVQAKLTAQYGTHARGAAEASKGLDHFNLSTVGARRELIVLGHEMSQGNWKNFGGSIMVLAERMDLMTALTSGAGLAVGAAAVAVGGFAFAAIKGAHEQEALNRAIEATSNYAGQTGQSVRDMARDVSAATTMTVGSAKTIITELVTSGKIGGAALGSVARLSSDYAKATGKDIDKVAPELVRLFEDPAKGAEELNKSMHFLTVTQTEHIASLVRLGETQKAQKELADELTAHLPAQATQVGFLERAWNGLGKELSEVWQFMKDIGAEKTPQQKLDELRQRGTWDSRYQNPQTAQDMEALRETIRLQGRMTTVSAETAAVNEQQAKSWDAIKQKSQVYHIQALEDEKKLIELRKSDTPEQESAKQDALRHVNLEIRDTYRAIGAEQRQSTQQQIEDQLRLSEIHLKVAADQIDTQFKLGQITEKQRDERMLDNTLELNYQKQIYEENLAGVAGLTKAEKQQHELRLKELQEEGKAAAAIGRNKIATDEKKYYDDLRKAVDTASNAEIDSLNKTIEAQKLHNVEIGKTAEEKEREKRIILEVGTAQLQLEVDALRYAVETVKMSKEMQDIYIARANALDIEIRKRRELAHLLDDASIKEADAAAAKQAAEEWKKTSEAIESTLYDAIANGGQAAGRKLKEYFAKLVLQPILAPVSAGIASFLNPAGAAAQGYGMAGNVANGYSLATSAGSLPWLSDFGGSMANAAQRGMNYFGGTSSVMSNGWVSAEGSSSYISQSASSFGQMAQTAGAIASYASALNDLKNGQYGSAIGTAAGQYFGGPIGAFIGNKIGGWVDSHVSGESRGGGQYGYDFAGQTLYNNRRGSVVAGATPGVNFLEGPSAGEIAGDQVRSAISTTVASINDMLKQLGSAATLTGFQAALETSDKGRGGVLAGGKLSTGATFGLSGAGDNYAGTLFDKTFDTSGDASKMIAQFTTELKQTTIQALQAAQDIPKSIKDELSQVDAKKLTDQTATALLSTIGAEVQGANQLRTALANMPLGKVANLSFDAADALLKLAGGVEHLQDLTNQIADYNQNFYSEGERMSILATQVNEEMSALGYANVTTKDQFRDLVDSLDKTSESGQKTWIELLKIEGAFAQVADYADKAAQDTIAAAKESAKAAEEAAKKQQQDQLAAVDAARNTLSEAYQRESSALVDTIKKFQDFAKTLRNFRDSLTVGNLSPLSPEQKYLELKRRAQDVVARANGGDQAAMADEQGVLQQFLEASQQQNSSTVAFAKDFDWVQRQLENGANAADRQAALAQQQLSALQTQVSQLININNSVITVQQAISSLVTAMAAAGMPIPSGIGGSFSSANGGTAANGGMGYDAWLAAHPGIPGGADALAYYNHLYGGGGTAVSSTSTAPGYSGWLAAHPGIPNDASSQAYYGNLQGITTRAGGGYTNPGLTLVGEEGPELVNFKRPGQVYTASQSRSIIGDGSKAIERLLQMIVVELQADKVQRGAVGVESHKRLDKVTEAMASVKRTLARSA